MKAVLLAYSSWGTAHLCMLLNFPKYFLSLQLFLTTFYKKTSQNTSNLFSKQFVFITNFEKISVKGLSKKLSVL